MEDGKEEKWRKGGGLDETCEEKRRKKTSLTLLSLHKIAKKCAERITHSNIIIILLK